MPKLVGGGDGCGWVRSITTTVLDTIYNNGNKELLKKTRDLGGTEAITTT